MRNLLVNKHIELVKKWLDDPSSVSKEELIVNRIDAGVAADVAYTAYEAARYAAYAAETAADNADNATLWVNKYEELTNGNK